jgi:opacity protein-like surface antigen
LVGFSARLRDDLRVSFDAEFYGANNTFTRIEPTGLQLYAVKLKYKPKGWFSFGSAISIANGSNNNDTIGNSQHNRSYAFNGTMAPPEGKWGVDLSYDYNDIFSQINICFVSTPTPPGSISCGTPFLSGVSVYNEKVNNGTVAIYAKPVRRVNVGVGYTITSTTGSTLILNPNAPTGPLSYNYHLPLATLAVDLTRNLTYKTGWNYYDYHEKSLPGPTLPRDVRGNVFTLSLRYTM